MYNKGDIVYIFKGKYKGYSGIIDEVCIDITTPVYTIIIEETETKDIDNCPSSLKIIRKKLCLTEENITKINRKR